MVLVRARVVCMNIGGIRPEIVKRAKGLSKVRKLQILYFLVFRDKNVLLSDISLLLLDKKYMKFDIFFICKGYFVDVPLQ